MKERGKKVGEKEKMYSSDKNQNPFKPSFGNCCNVNTCGHQLIQSEAPDRNVYMLQATTERPF